MRETVNKIYSIIRSNKWFDFHILAYDGRSIKIGGGIDLSYYHSLEIFFTDIFFVHGFFETWHSDTKEQVFVMPDSKSDRELNLKYEIEQGYQIFIFRTEGYENDVYIAAKQISFKENVVKYYEEKQKE